MENHHQATHAMRQCQSCRCNGISAEMQIKRYFLAILLVMLPTVSWSFDSKNLLSGYLLPAIAFKPVVIANLPPEIDALDYREGELPVSYVSDLNGDGVLDYLIVAPPIICGTGGCPYLLVDGKSGRAIGEFFGSAVAQLNQKINGYPVIQTVSKQEIDTFVFDGKVYRLVASSLLGESGMAEWLKTVVREKQP